MSYIKNILSLFFVMVFLGATSAFRPLKGLGAARNAFASTRSVSMANPKVYFDIDIGGIEKRPLTAKTNMTCRHFCLYRQRCW